MYWKLILRKLSNLSPSMSLQKHIEKVSPPVNEKKILLTNNFWAGHLLDACMYWYVSVQLYFVDIQSNGVSVLLSVVDDR